MAKKFRVKYLILIKLEKAESKEFNQIYCDCGSLESLYYVPLLDKLMCSKCISDYVTKHMEVNINICKLQMDNYNKVAEKLNLPIMKIPMKPLEVQRIYFIDSHKETLGSAYVQYTEDDIDVNEQAKLKVEFLGHNLKDCIMFLTTRQKLLKSYENL